MGSLLDFVRRVYEPKGRKPIIATASTVAHGKPSKIVAKFDGPVTTPGIDTAPSSPSSAGPILEGCLRLIGTLQLQSLEPMLLVANP